MERDSRKEFHKHKGSGEKRPRPNKEGQAGGWGMRAGSGSAGGGSQTLPWRSTSPAETGPENTTPSPGASLSGLPRAGPRLSWGPMKQSAPTSLPPVCILSSAPGPAAVFTTQALFMLQAQLTLLLLI